MANATPQMQASKPININTGDQAQAPDLNRFRELAAKAPPGALRLGMPIDEATFKAMREKQGINKTVKLGPTKK